MFGWLFTGPLAVGSVAPDFELPADDGTLIRLADYRGRQAVVLVWYPGDNTQVCTRQLCEFRDAWAQVRAANVAVLGVNPQAAEKHADFRRKQAFPFPLLVDAGQRVGRLYRTDGWIVKRTVYLVDTNGVIRFAGRGKPDPARVLAAISA